MASAEEPPIYIWNAGIGRWLRMDTTTHNSEMRPLDGVLDQGFRYRRTTRRLCRESSLGRQCTRMAIVIGRSEALPQESIPSYGIDAVGLLSAHEDGELQSCGNNYSFPPNIRNVFVCMCAFQLLLRHRSYCKAT